MKTLPLPALTRRPAVRRRPPFTPIELLVVIAVIALLASFLLPALNTAKEKTRRVKCLSQLKLVGQALRLYATDYDDVYPDGDNAVGLAKLYTGAFITGTDYFVCPSIAPATIPDVTLDDAHLDYVYRGTLSLLLCGPSVGLAADRTRTANHAKYGNVLFGDGHVTGFIGSDWASQDNAHGTGGWPADPH